MSDATSAPLPAKKNSPARVLMASLVGTTIEFFDFYIYATAAVLVFPTLFFPESDPTSATLKSFATFSIAFFARPVGAFLFGHFGDKIGRKATLVAALMLMGLSTVAIGLLPSYASIGITAPILLALCRLGQGLGLGGEWGGAILLATENAPEGKRTWYGMFPQLGAPLGFILSAGSFLLLDEFLTDEQFFSFGWRIPFLLSFLLVAVGLYVRLKISETPQFQKVIDKQERVAVPMFALLKSHKMSLLLGTLSAVATYVLFYIMTVFALNWGTSSLGYHRDHFLLIQMVGVIFFGLTIPLSAILSDRYNRQRILIIATVLIGLFSFTLQTLFAGGDVGIFALCIIGFALMGFTYGPIGAALAGPFPTAVRYTGASMTFNLAGILGASLAPYIATWLATHYGVSYVGYYVLGAAVLSLIALLCSNKHAVSA